MYEVGTTPVFAVLRQDAFDAWSVIAYDDINKVWTIVVPDAGTEQTAKTIVKSLDKERNNG